MYPQILHRPPFAEMHSEYKIQVWRFKHIVINLVTNFARKLKERREWLHDTIRLRCGVERMCDSIELFIKKTRKESLVPELRELIHMSIREPLWFCGRFCPRLD